MSPLSSELMVKAKLRLRTTAEGGRLSGIKSGYRPNHVFEYDERGNIKGTYIGEVTFDEEWIHPGNEAIVTVEFLRDRLIEQCLSVGRKWRLHEGINRIGEAEILELTYT